MADIVPPPPASVDSRSLSQWHTVFKTPWEVLIGLDYVDGAELALHAGIQDALTTAQGEVAPDDTDQTLEEKELAVAGEAVFLVSTDAGDTHDIVVLGVNADGDSDSVTVTLNGLTPVAVPSAHASNFWFNVNRMANASSSSQVGVIYCSTKSIAGEPDNTNNIQCKMPIGTEFASNPMVMAGVDEVLVFIGMDLSTSLKDQMEFRIARRLSQSRPWIRVFKVLSFESYLPYRFTVPIVIKGGQKILFTVKNTIGSDLDMTWQANFYSLNAKTVGGGSGVAILFGV